ncbi:hypothetical protein RI367_005800 [Sorochytrium milnesiophthora]
MLQQQQQQQQQRRAPQPLRLQRPLPAQGLAYDPPSWASSPVSELTPGLGISLDAQPAGLSITVGSPYPDDGPLSGQTSSPFTPTVTAFSSGAGAGGSGSGVSGTGAIKDLDDFRRRASDRISLLTHARAMLSGTYGSSGTAAVASETGAQSNVVSRDTMMAEYDASTLGKKRALPMYWLGVSLGNILDIGDPLDFVRAVALLMYEFENETRDEKRSTTFVPSSFTPTVLLPVSIPKLQITSQNGGGDGGSGPASAEDPLNISFAFKQSGTYTYLETPSLPFEPSASVVLYTLSDVVQDVYTRVANVLEDDRHQGHLKSLLAIVSKIDSKLQRVVGSAARDVANIHDQASEELLGRRLQQLSTRNGV